MWWLNVARNTAKLSVLDFLSTDSVSRQRGEQHYAKVKVIGALKSADRFRPVRSQHVGTLGRFDDG